ncbi:hypothetical protein Tco_1503636 [Tanacetum coccineum]
MFETAQYLLEMKQSRKASKHDFILQQYPKSPGEGFGMAPEVLDRPSGSSSSSSSKSKDREGFLPTDDEANPDKSDLEKKTKDAQEADEQAREEQVMYELTGNIQAKDSIPEPQVEKLAVPHPSSSVTLSSTEYGNQFINDNPDVSLTNVLKDQAEIKIQSMVEVLVQQENPTVQRPPLVDAIVTMIPETTTLSLKQPPPNKPPPKRNKTKILLKKSKKQEEKVDADAVLQKLIKPKKKVDRISKIDHSEAINKHVQAHLKKLLPTATPRIDKLKLEKAAMQSMPKHSTKPIL